jgi:tetratricopeptide (TPR) repeat protein
VTESPSGVLLNELAWLCARSGEKLQEARELAERAVIAAPGEGAYLDTLAEANFQLGNFDNAIRLEQAVIELEPGDPFMVQQLERFRRGKASTTQPTSQSS